MINDLTSAGGEGGSISDMIHVGLSLSFVLLLCASVTSGEERAYRWVHANICVRMWNGYVQRIWQEER